MVLLSTSETARMLGISERQVQNWIKDGIVNTLRKGQGRGNHHLLDLMSVLAIACARDCRQRGMSLLQASHVCEWLLNHSLESLQEQWRRGQVFLFVVGDEVSPLLCSREMLFNNPDIDLVKAHTIGLPVAILNLESAYRKIIGRIEADRATQSEDSSREMASHED